MTPSDLVLINIKDFGIKTIKESGMDETKNADNNSQLIATAMRNSEDKILYFPPGEYYFKETLNIGQGQINAPHKIIFSGGTIFKPSSNFSGSSLISIYETKKIEIEGGTINLLNRTENGILCTSANKTFKNITVKNANKFGIEVFGEGLPKEIKNISLKNIETIDCLTGGIFINSIKNVQIINCNNSGGLRAIGTKAPIAKPNDLENVIIQNCSSRNTTGFGIQTYYGKNIHILNCYVQGNSLRTDDKSCITIDRSNLVEVHGNIVESNTDKSVIFVTGSENVSITNNKVKGGRFGIQSCFNFEQEEDASIDQSRYITISGNILENNDTSITLNGSMETVIANNICTSTKDSLVIYGQKYISKDMTSSKITVTSNICNNNISNSGGTYVSYIPINYLGNICKNYEGIRQQDVVIGNGLNSLRLGNKQIENFANTKRSPMNNDQWISEYNLQTNDIHKGMRWKYQYGFFNIYNTLDELMFKFNIGNNYKQEINEVGNLEINQKGKGLILTSPDGNIKKKIIINNQGTIELTDI